MKEIWDEYQVFEEDSIMLHSEQQALRWLRKERDQWRWLWEEDQGGSSLAPTNYSGIGSTLDTMISYIEQGDALKNQNYKSQKNRGFGGHQNSPLVSSSDRGQTVLAIKNAVGVPEARWVYKLMQGPLNLSEIKTATDLRGAFLFADPSFAQSASLSGELKKERTRYRTEISNLQRRVREFEQEKRDREARRGRQMRRIVGRFRKVISDKSDSLTNRFQEESQKSIAQILETENLYRKQMELQAPVEYWQEKSKLHGRWELGFTLLSVAYFVIASLLIYYAANWAADYILALKATEDRTPVYIITSGALLGFTTLIFWVGRLVVKLWLSEHHLRVDADERAIMTKTYLAMTANDAASDADRAIVLSSVFRPTPDGVVKEEGPGDIGLNALLAKLLSRPSN